MVDDPNIKTPYSVEAEEANILEEKKEIRKSMVIENNKLIDIK